MFILNAIRLMLNGGITTANQHRIISIIKKILNSCNILENKIKDKN